MNDRTLTRLRRRVARQWPHKPLDGTHQEWLETLAHVLPKEARRAVVALSDQGAPAPTPQQIVERVAQIREAAKAVSEAKREYLPDEGYAQLTLKVRLRLNPIVHSFWNMTKWVGMRDRLRCPSCHAVGTWKPHGDLVSRIRYGDRPVRRWMCKWCGRYEGPEGVTKAWPRSETKVWVVEAPDFKDREPTPRELVAPTWPWRG
jgi:rubredoxin